jgi:hypothetical protein
MTTTHASLDESLDAARAASRVLARMSPGGKTDALEAVAVALLERADEIIEANAADVQGARESNAASAMVDRLMLDEPRLDAMARGIRAVAALPDPVGVITGGWRVPNGLEIVETRVPLGVIGVIYEGRPNVTTDAAALAEKMDLCVGVDTGLIHLSSSVGVPAVVIVGPTDPNRWSPWQTESIVLRSARVSPTLTEQILTACGAADGFRWPLGRADAADIPYEDVEAAVSCLLLTRTTHGRRTIDLTRGSYRYEILESAPAVSGPVWPAAVDRRAAIAADSPAT